MSNFFLSDNLHLALVVIAYRIYTPTRAYPDLRVKFPCRRDQPAVTLLYRQRYGIRTHR